MPADDSLPCPICGTPVALPEDQRPDSFPFCTPRCRIRDLGAWADGRYGIPGQPLGPWDDPDEALR